MIPILAHGALGNWDELIFISVAAIFMVMMGISWIRSRNMDISFEDDAPAKETNQPAPADDIRPPDRFELD